MAKGNLDTCLAVTLKHEGGWADHPKDPGGATMYGVTLATYRRYRPYASKTTLRNIPMAHVQEIYRDGYWKPVLGDSLPLGVDLAVFDYGVNSGPGRAVRDLQRVVGAAVDGKAGAETVLKTAKADGKKTIQALCARRLSFMQSLAIWKTFGKGWSRRVADIEAKAVAMALSHLPASSKQIALEAEARKADQKAREQNKQAAGTPVVGGGGAVGADAALGGDANWLLIGCAVAAVVIVTILLVIHARKNRERARAYSAAAAG